MVNKVPINKRSATTNMLISIVIFARLRANRVGADADRTIETRHGNTTRDAGETRPEAEVRDRVKVHSDSQI
jgi:hypothetical protein